MTTPDDFISELREAVLALVTPAPVFVGHAPDNTRGEYVVITYDLNDVEPDFENDEAIVQMRVSLDCCSFNNSDLANAMSNAIRLQFKNFSGELVPGGDAQVQLSQREDVTIAPIVVGNLTCHQTILRLLFMYQED